MLETKSVKLLLFGKMDEDVGFDSSFFVEDEFVLELRFSKTVESLLRFSSAVFMRRTRALIRSFL